LATFLGIAAALGFASSSNAQDTTTPATTTSTPKAKAAEEAKKTDGTDATKTETTKTDATKTGKVEPKLEFAYFGGGCFWCLEAFFERVHGVKQVVSGFAGGNVARPSYELVCTGTTGHAEVVAIEFDANVISYDELLDVFWLCHDPTTLNRQGPDHGTQYRSIILYTDDEQKKLAEKSKQKITDAELYRDPIVTQIVPLAQNKFYSAEKYHQDYFRRNANRNPYCQNEIVPRMRELRAKLNSPEVRARLKMKEASTKTQTPK
jgi:peptide-methionine (S)-S-oxide reductase